MHTAGTVKIIPQDGPAKPPPLAAGALHYSRQPPSEIVLTVLDKAS